MSRIFVARRKDFNHRQDLPQFVTYDYPVSFPSVPLDVRRLYKTCGWLRLRLSDGGRRGGPFHRRVPGKLQRHDVRFGSAYDLLCHGEIPGGRIPAFS